MNIFKKKFSFTLMALFSLFCNTSVASDKYSISDFNSMPINIVESGVKPRVIINVSNDHQLFFKAFNDYSDLDGDGVAEATYMHEINYYGYFDSYKCYDYSSANSRFEPKSFTSSKYCTVSGGGEWSGNFLNWLAMSRIDTIRKILYGGHRRVDSSTGTVLERSYIPHDAHSWAKFYGGGDLSKLTPFGPTSSGTPGSGEYYCDDGNAIDNAGVVNSFCKDPADDPDYFKCETGSVSNDARCFYTTDPYNYDCSQTTSTGASAHAACEGVSVHDPRYRRNRWNYTSAEDYQDKDWDGTPVDRKKVGVTFGNTTDVNIGNYQTSNTGSEAYTEPPLIKVVRGNYSLWASNERWQCTWSSGAAMDNHSASNANNTEKSLIPSYSSSPSWSEHLGDGNYIARVEACVAGLIDSAAIDAIADSTKEKCKRYPGPDGKSGTADDNYKPIGLLQSYGDDDKMYFGMIAGSYKKHASGGDLIRNTGSLSDEINIFTDGSFPLVANFGKNGGIDNNKADGMINALSLYRIARYDGYNGYYNSLDNCSYGLSAYADVTSENKCWNWGNPFAEIYYASLNYLSGKQNIGQYQSNVSNVIPGLPQPQASKDPLEKGEYCAQLSVVNLNASNFSYDYDQLDNANFGPQTLWDKAVLPGAKDTAAMTNAIGAGEGINSQAYYIGQTDLSSNSEDQLCTAKTINYLGTAGGICPEAPRLYGSYRIAGLAYYSHTKDIRPAIHKDTALEGEQVVDTYAVALATGAPIIKISDPDGSTSEPLATILPACQNSSLNPKGSCALVDFKIISQKVDSTNQTVSGSYYINWEDSEQGGDYDQDMWGTLEYVLDKSKKTLTITTQVQAQSTGDAMAFGYVLDGTVDDGFHAHSGINGYKRSETALNFDCNDTNGCRCTATAGAHAACNADDSGASKKIYTLGSSSAKLLKDPLWYAAKWGGFTDSNGNNLPDLQEEWDSKKNSTGEIGSDGIPDNYYYATDPRELESSLDQVFKAILERTSSGTAAAVVSSNVSGEGALYQAYYEPLKKDENTEARWLGTLQALWLDSSGNSRQDCTPPDANSGINSITGKCLVSPHNLKNGECTPNGRLDNYCVDQVVETYYDELEKRTRTRIYESDNPNKYTAYGMQGIVKSFNLGTAVIVPNSMEGMMTYTSTPEKIVLSPYKAVGTLAAYDPVTGVGTVDVTSWTGPAGSTYSSWHIVSSTTLAEGYSTSSLHPIAGGTVTFTASPAGPWLTVGDVITLATKNVIGANGENFSDWDVECLDGTAKGNVTNVSLQLNNSADATFSVSTITPDFGSCTMAKISSYNLKGTEGESYNQWTVSNLNTLSGTGSSTTSLTLGNSGARTLTVDPTSSWLSAGDQILVASYSFTTKELYQIGYLWNAREQLYLPFLSDTTLATNRSWLTSAQNSRFIKTWVDRNLNGVIDSGEYRDFDSGMLSTSTSNPVSHTFFDVDSVASAQSVINYVRGIESSGTRNRTIRYAENDATKHVMRLGDVVNSTPAVVGPPKESFNLLYKDSSYSKFVQQYINRRNVVYAGGNDGMIHAFNAGFYNSVTVNEGTENAYTTIQYLTSGKDHNGNTAPPHPLGSEIWAYVPYNLLPHLQWLKAADYGDETHVYFMDGKPRIFDAKIFTEDDDHPAGWGTVLVIGMNLGGGSMSIDVDDDNNVATPTKGVVSKSAYVLLDITNPEVEPKLLAEIPMPDQSFTTVYPAVVAFQDVSSNTNCQGTTGTMACNSWFLMFGNGPNSFDYTSNKNAKIYMYDLSQLRTKTATPSGSMALPTNCLVQTINSQSNVMVCDTQQANSFIGSPSVADWDLDFRSDCSYFGTVGVSTSNNTTEDDGSVFRLPFNNQAQVSLWGAPTLFYDAGKPVVSQPVPSIDDSGNRWIFFGTGRYFSTYDKTTTDRHYLYGVKDPKIGVTYPISSSSLLDVSNVEIYLDGTLSASVAPISGTALTSFSQIENEIDTEANGWKMYLPPIVGNDATPTPSTRSLSRQALIGGVLFSTVFEPSCDPCEGEGQSRLYGLYYKTGTAHPDKAILGSTVEESGSTVKYRLLKYLNLGRGVATTPSVHSGSDNEGVKIFTQLSTGEIVESEADTVLQIRSGRTSWQDK